MNPWRPVWTIWRLQHGAAELRDPPHFHGLTLKNPVGAHSNNPRDRPRGTLMAPPVEEKAVILKYTQSLLPYTKGPPSRGKYCARVLSLLGEKNSSHSCPRSIPVPPEGTTGSTDCSAECQETLGSICRGSSSSNTGITSVPLEEQEEPWPQDTGAR